MSKSADSQIGRQQSNLLNANHLDSGGASFTQLSPQEMAVFLLQAGWDYATIASTMTSQSLPDFEAAIDFCYRQELEKRSA
jgi:hypothetical protein